MKQIVENRLGGILAATTSFAIVILLLGGCQNSGLTGANEGGAGGNSSTGREAGIAVDNQLADGTAMGRYLEKVSDLGGTLGGYREKLFVLGNGNLKISQPMADIYASNDNGITWEEETSGWLDELLQDGGYLEDVAFGVDGTVGIVYSYLETEDSFGEEENFADTEDTGKEADDASDAEDTDKEADDASDAGNSGREEDNSMDTGNSGGEEDNSMNTGNSGGEEDNSMDTGNSSGEDDPDDDNFKEESMEAWYASMQTHAFIIKSDGTQVPITLPAEEKDSPRHIWISDEGRIFVGTDNPTLYEIGEDGSGKAFLALEGIPQLIQFSKNRMIIDGYNYDSLVIYDLETETYIEDDILHSFVKENYGDRSFGGGSWYDLFFFAGEDDILYLAGSQGVHRHVISGSAMEQIIDADLSTFGNPSYRLLGMLALDNNEFMALFTNARLVRYVYDATIPTVPNKKIKAYSLENNTMLRRAIFIYQTEHPEAYVEYEIGMEEDSAVTREDALKKLNTQILAGEGPDLLILDGMPADSYIEKGLLKDITPLLEELEEDEALFENIAGAFQRDGKIYMIPCEANLPTIAGSEEYVAQMTDLSGIADGMEALRRDYPTLDLLMWCSEKTILMNFVTVCAPAWKTIDGKIDPEAVEEYLIQMKRIYDAQMDGLSEEAIQRFAEWEKDSMTYWNESLDDQKYYSYTMDEFNYIVGDGQFLAGLIDNAFAYAELTSVQRISKFEEDIILPMNGQSSNVFCASTVTGINALSENTEHAEGLLKVLLGDEDITSLGFPVNRRAFEKNLYPDNYVSPDEIYTEFRYLQEDGTAYTWNIYWFDEPQADELRRRMETVNTPYVENAELQEAVLHAGTAYMRGEMSLEEAVLDVEKRMAIYLAE